MNATAAIFTTVDDLERALAALNEHGFDRQSVYWCDMKRQRPPRPRGFLDWVRSGGVFGDTIDHADQVSLMDGTCVGATIAGLLGLSLGSVWRLGSVTAGVLGMALGGLAGWCVDQLVRATRGRRSEQPWERCSYLVMVDCARETDVQTVRQVFQASRGSMIGYMQWPPAGAAQAEPDSQSTAIV